MSIIDSISGAGTKLAGIAIPPWLKAALGIYFGYSMAKDLAGTGWQAYGANKRINAETELGKKRLDTESAVAKMMNEENRKSTDKYMAMLSQQSQKETEERHSDRQMQLVMAMLANNQNLGQTMTQAAERSIPSNPYAMSVLTRPI
jgi:uncharacterized membrane protein YhiD involved in acid resistance